MIKRTLRQLEPAQHWPAPAAPADSKQPNVFFGFEADFTGDHIRCVPMIVRFRLDACGVKLTLREWSCLNNKERVFLATIPLRLPSDLLRYRALVQQMIFKRTERHPADLAIDANPPWAQTDTVPAALQEKLAEFGWQLPVPNWRGLQKLQRFALLKLCRPGHENHNFPIAMKEFGLI